MFLIHFLYFTSWSASGAEHSKEEEFEVSQTPAEEL